MSANLNEMEKSFEVVVIGGGLSGLTTAAILSKAGLKVAVLEMGDRPGGYLAGFKRKDFHFDSAIHWLNQCGETGYVSKVFSMIENNYPKVKPLTKIRRYVYNNPEMVLTNNPDQFKNVLISKFLYEKKGIELFFSDARKMAEALNDYKVDFRDSSTRSLKNKVLNALSMAKFGLCFLPYILYSGEKGIQKGLKKYFNDPEIVKMWSSEVDLLSCLIPIAWAYNNDYQLPPEGGGSVFAEWLEKVIKSCGNEIFYKTEAKKILNKGNTATRIKAVGSNGVIEFETRFIVAACDVETLYEKMMESSISNPSFLEKLRNAEIYSSATTLYIGLNCPAEQLGFSEETILISDDSVARGEHSTGIPEKTDIMVFSPSARDKSMAPENKGTLTIYVSSFFDQFDCWGTEKNEKGEFVRTEKYREIKKNYGKILVQRVEQKLGIEITSHIEVMDIATPVTYHRYTGNKFGSMMGARPGKANFKAKIAHFRTPLKNVFLSGHWSVLGGGVPIAVATGANAALMVLKEENREIFSLLSDYLEERIDNAELNSKITVLARTRSF